MLKKCFALCDSLITEGGGLCSEHLRKIAMSNECRILFAHFTNECVQECSEDLSTALTLLDVVYESSWEALHTGSWKDVSQVWRDSFSLVSLILAYLQVSEFKIPCIYTD